MSSIISKLINLAGNITGTLGVSNGGTGLASGTSGGVLGFTASGTVASSAALGANSVVIGGGAGATPTTITAGTNGQLLVGVTSGAPAFGSSISADTTFTGNVNVGHLLNFTAASDASTGTVNSASLNNGNVINFNASTTITLNGINSGGTVQNGTIAIVYNNTGNSMTINNLSGSASAADRISINGAASGSKTLVNGASAWFVYVGRWNGIVSG